MSKRWLKERRRDFYYKLAKKEHYRSRAAYKLKQINARFNIIKRGDIVIDLGAAPGGWSQIAHELVGFKGLVIAVDLQKIKPIEGVEFFKGDFRKQSTVESILSFLQREFNILSSERLIDVVISDMSPDISGNYSVDHARCVELCEHALNFAQNNLKVTGNFLTKIFQGDLFDEYLEKVKKNFRFVKAHSPKASRDTSSEIYIVAKGFYGF